MSGSRGNGNDWPSGECRVFAPSLAAFAEDALPPAEAHAVAAHLAGCDRCAQRVAAFAEVDALIHAAPLPTPPASLRAGLYARISARSSAAETRQASNGHLATELEL